MDPVKVAAEICVLRRWSNTETNFSGLLDHTQGCSSVAYKGLATTSLCGKGDSCLRGTSIVQLPSGPVPPSLSLLLCCFDRLSACLGVLR